MPLNVLWLFPCGIENGIKYQVFGIWYLVWHSSTATSLTHNNEFFIWSVYNETSKGKMMYENRHINTNMPFAPKSELQLSQKIGFEIPFSDVLELPRRTGSCLQAQTRTTGKRSSAFQGLKGVMSWGGWDICVCDEGAWCGDEEGTRIQTEPRNERCEGYGG